LVLGLFKVGYWNIKNWREKFFSGIGLFKTLFVGYLTGIFIFKSNCVRERKREVEREEVK